MTEYITNLINPNLAYVNLSSAQIAFGSSTLNVLIGTGFIVFAIGLTGIFFNRR